MGNGSGRITVMTLRGLQKMFGFRRLLRSRRPNECPKYKHQLAYRSCSQGSTIVSPPHLAQLSPPSNVDNNPAFNGQVSIERAAIKMVHEWPL